MSAFSDAFLYLNDPFNWTSSRGILFLAGQHLRIAGLALLLALVVAVPPAIWLGHTGRAGGFLLGLSNVSRAVPTLAVLTIFVVTPIGFSLGAPVLALALFAVPPVLANTYVGFRGVDRDVVEAARAMGMTERQVALRAELPLALPLVMTGIRTAAVQVVATATLASLLGTGTLGTVIRSGFGRQDYGTVVAGALLVAALAVATDLLLALIGWAVTPGRRRLPGRARRVPAEPAALAATR